MSIVGNFESALARLDMKYRNEKSNVEDSCITTTLAHASEIWTSHPHIQKVKASITPC